MSSSPVSSSPTSIERVAVMGLGKVGHLAAELLTESGLEVTGVGLEDEYLGLHHGEIGDSRKRTSRPHGVADSNRVAPPVPLQHHDPAVRGPDLEGGKAFVGLLDLDVGLASLDGQELDLSLREMVLDLLRLTGMVSSDFGELGVDL